MTYEIEKDIPSPKLNGKGKSKYPFALMKVGDSFFIQIKKPPHQIYGMAKYHKTKVCMQKENDGYRVWRIE